MLPEEKLAVRLLQRHDINCPPFNLVKLSENYATVEYRPFPSSADGLVIGMGERGTPEILINSNNHALRNNFTLAHELGHVIIPWHTGTIISHTNAENDVLLEWDYREVEGEANRFAAELLMPSDWIKEAFNTNNNSVESLIGFVMKNSRTSLDATLIKVFNVIKHPISLIEYNYNNEITNKFSTAGSPTIDENIFVDESPFKTPYELEKFSINNRNYVSAIFDFNSLEFIESDTREWRVIIDQILSETHQEDKKQSVNAILAAAFHRSKELSFQEKCVSIVKSYDGRRNIKPIVQHSLFDQYVIKRVNELTAKNLNNN